MKFRFFEYTEKVGILEQGAESLAQIRSQLIDRLLLISGVMVIPLVIASLIRLFEIGWHANFTLHLVLVILLWTLILFRGQLSTHTKVLAALSFLFAIGLGGLYEFGLVGTAPLAFSLACVVAVVFFGLPAGWTALAFSTLYILGMMIMIWQGKVTYHFNQSSYAVNPLSWIDVAAGFFTFTGMTVLIVAVIQGALSHLLQSLAQRQQLLEKVNSDLLTEAQNHREDEDALRESEERYRTIFKSNIDAYFLYDPDGHIIDANPKACEMFGYSYDEIIHLTARDLIEPSFHHRYNYSVKIGIGEWFHADSVNIRKDGSPFDVEVYITKVWYHGNEQMLAIARDISQQKRLRDTMYLFSDIVNTMQLGLYVYHLEDWADDRSLRLVTANPASSTALGLQESEILGKTMDEIFPGLRAKGIPSRYAEVVRTGKSFSIDDFAYEDGRIPSRFFSFKVFPLPGNRVGVLFEDTTDRKKTEIALRESEAKFQSVFNQAAVGMAILSPDGIWMQLNPVVSTITGYDPSELIGHSFIAITHPDDVPADMSAIRKIMSRETDHVYLQKRYVHKNGDSVWINLYVTLVRDSGGRPLYYIVILDDITKIKQVEEEKRQFYRETISSVTEGKLQIVGSEEAHEYEQRSDLQIIVREYLSLQAIRQQVSLYLQKQSLPEEQIHLLVTGLGEAVTNAIKHAGGGQVFCGHLNGTIWVGVSDTGAGISTLTLPNAALRRGYSTKISMGMGYTIMLDVSDRVMLSTGSTGTTVVLFIDNLEKPIRSLSLDDLPDIWDNIGSP